MRKRVGRMAAAVAVVAAVISGCGAGPSQVGAAAIIGPEAIPLERVQSQLDVAMRQPDQFAQLEARGFPPAEIARFILTEAVQHELLQRRAAAEGIVVTDAQVSAALAARSGPPAGTRQLLRETVYDTAGLRERVRDDLIAARLAERAVPGLVVTVDLLGAASRADAEEMARTLAAGGPQAEALFDGDAAVERDLVVNAVTQPGAAFLFGFPAGTALVYPAGGAQSGWNVAHITERRTDAPAEPGAVERLSQDQLISMGMRLLQPTARELGIRINPRYGVWDPLVQRVVAEGQRVGLVVLPEPARAS